MDEVGTVCGGGRNADGGTRGVPMAIALSGADVLARQDQIAAVATARGCSDSSSSPLVRGAQLIASKGRGEEHSVGHDLDFGRAR